VSQFRRRAPEQLVTDRKRCVWKTLGVEAKLTRSTAQTNLLRTQLLDHEPLTSELFDLKPTSKNFAFA